MIHNFVRFKSAQTLIYPRCPVFPNTLRCHEHLKALHAFSFGWILKIRKVRKEKERDYTQNMVSKKKNYIEREFNGFFRILLNRFYLKDIDNKIYSYAVYRHILDFNKIKKHFLTQQKNFNNTY